MNCPHLRSGRCTLAEKILAHELEIVVECPANESLCGRCMGKATQEKPTSAVLATAAPHIPFEWGHVWSDYCLWIVRGKPRGRGDKVARAIQTYVPQPLVNAGKAILAAVSGGDCGCLGRQKTMNERHPCSDGQSDSQKSNASIQSTPGEAGPE